MTERFGFGLNVRYSRGTTNVRLGNRSPTSLEFGGTHVAGRLRMTFGKPRKLRHGDMNSGT